LFCDLVGSTEIAARLDPEEWRETVAAYHRAAAEAVTRYGGHVAKYLGDGVMAFFGYPEAHDNDAERAARAGLELLDTISKLNEQTDSLPLKGGGPGRGSRPKLTARVGIDSGAVVVGAGAGNEADVFGEAPNIAARVQAAAEPGTVLITDAMHQLVSGLFVVESRGAATFKGIERPLELYRVVQPSGVRGRLEAAAAVCGLTPFVGREDELRLLNNRWERVLEGEGQMVLVIGEAGIGKSRLVHRFHEMLGGTPYLWIDAAAGALFQNSPFYPVTEMLRQALFASGNGPPDAIAQMAGALSHAGVDPSSAVPVLAPLLNLTLPPEYSPWSLPPEQQRRRLLALLVEWILGTARARPLIIAIEDLHWADPSTLDLLQLLVEQGNTAPLFLLFTARPEFHPAWPLRAHHGQLNLNHLGTRDIRTMVTQVAAQKALTDETISAVIERTGGVPLFVEELTRAVLERGEAKLAGRAIPATLHDSLMARLDKLGPARETLQTGAVLGSEFSYELLQAVHQLEDSELQRRLRTLIDRELLYVRGIAPEASYQFKHALIRDAAYEALLKSRRKELHQLVAQTIDTRFSAIKETHPEVLAHHWAQAGEKRLAIIEWQKAANAADVRASFLEAADGYQKALALIDELGDLDELRSLELEISSSLARVLTITKGLTAAESVKAAAHARVVAERSGSMAELVLREYGTWNVVFTLGNHANSAALAAHLLELALHEGSPTSLAFARQAQLSSALFRGKLIELEEHFRSFSLVCDRADFSEFPGEKLFGFTFASIGVWISGKPDTARARMMRGVACARESGHPYDLAFASFSEAWLYRLLREHERAEAAAAQAISTSKKHDFSLVRDLASGYMGGIVITQVGGAEHHLAMAQRGLDSLIAVGARAGITDLLYCLAVAHEQSGMTEAAERLLDEALTANPEEKAFLPNLLTYRGDLRRRRGDLAMAESDFRESIAMAQSMSAKSWELRATTSLARLLRDTDRRDEVHSMLAEIYNWFTEGFDTIDLKEAKTLLGELAT
jgi:class 3 adenylate cyclase/tetratricopeptide (TPR) repeat protein